MWLAWLVVAAWVVPGFLVYGLCKGAHRSYYEHFEHIGHSSVEERMCRRFASLGLIGLLAFCISCLDFTFYPGRAFQDGICFCLFMPAELKAPRVVKVRQDK